MFFCVLHPLFKKPSLAFPRVNGKGVTALRMRAWVSAHTVYEEHFYQYSAV